MSIESIKQTSKTILFETFKRENADYQSGNTAPTPTLLNIIDNDRGMDEIFREVDKTLSVSSFDEFVEKFTPVIYEQVILNQETGEPNFNYTFEKPRGDCKAINITEQPFYKMILQMYISKGKSGTNNYDFNYSDIQEMLTPNRIVKRAKNIRSELEYNFNKYLQLEENHAPESELDYYIDKVTDLREQIVENYNNNLLSLLPLALNDVQTKLQYLDENTKSSDNALVTSEQPKLISCSCTFDSEGNIKFEENPIDTEIQNGNVALENSSNSCNLLEIIEQDYYENVPENKQSDFIKNLTLSTYVNSNSTNALLTNLNKEVLLKQRDSYAQTYKNAQENFAKQVIAIVEKIINVKAFFDHATTNGNLNSTLIVANCQIDELLDMKKDAFKKFIVHMGNEYASRKIWFAIVPALSHDKITSTKKSGTRKVMGGSLHRSKNTDNSKKDEGLVPYTRFKEFMEIMEQAKIITFFNFKGSEKTGFSALTPEMIKNYKEVTTDISNDKEISKYSVLCYPNFTVLPKYKTNNKILERQTEDGRDNSLYLTTPSAYIDASYVACGMVVSTQNWKFLRQKGFNTLEDYPPIRFDFECSAENKDGKLVKCSHVITTKMNRESILNWSSDVKEAIDENGGFGFCFCCNTVNTSDGNLLQNAFVYKSRTLCLEKSQDETIGSIYRPLFKTLSVTCIMNHYNNINNFKEETNKWSRERNLKFINNPLYKVPNETEEKETITLLENENKIKFHYHAVVDDEEIIVDDN